MNATPARPRPSDPRPDGLLLLAAALGLLAGVLSAASLARAECGEAEPSAPLDRAHELLAEGHDNRAVFHLRRHLEARPADLDARALLARTYWRLGLSKPALAEVHLVLAQEPEHRTGLLTLAGIQVDRGLHEEAVETLSRLERQDADDDPAVDLLHGRALLGARRAAQALAKLRRALAAGPDDPGILNLLGLAALRTGERSDLPEARDAFARALELGGGSAALHNNLGFAHERLGELQEAWLHYSEAEGLSGGQASYAANRERVERALSASPARVASR